MQASPPRAVCLSIHAGLTQGHTDKRQACRQLPPVARPLITQRDPRSAKLRAAWRELVVARPRPEPQFPEQATRAGGTRCWKRFVPMEGLARARTQEGAVTQSRCTVDVFER
ncbi:hypothetical protein C8Q79DRAFT_538990 [Trametes meyenii]|nr:hypothetical protein C8Q79DRAFT_538990 [Trametes meyenii]